MALTPDLETAAGMSGLARLLSAALQTRLVLLVASGIGAGVAIRTNVVAPCDWQLTLDGQRIQAIHDGPVCQAMAGILTGVCVDELPDLREVTVTYRTPQTTGCGSMEITGGTRRNTTASVRHTHSGQIISAVVLTSLALLIGGAIALCVALLQQRLLAPASLYAPHGNRRGCVTDRHRQLPAEPALSVVPSRADPWRAAAVIHGLDDLRARQPGRSGCGREIRRVVLVRLRD